MRKMHDTTKEDFEAQSQNVYEAILVIGNRARQINEHHKHILNKIHDEYQSTVNLSEDAPDEPEDITIPDFPKPTVKAMNEMLDGEITYDYLEPHESGPEES
jgi:DNA-directed RNA polymerase subunit K/omega